MIRIGITGGIGSGKSTLCKTIAELGIPVYNADERAKEVMAHDQGVRSAVIRDFGEGAYTGNLPNRAVLAAAVFAAPDKLARLNAIVHPAVFADFETWAREQERQGAKAVAVESAILVESGMVKSVDKVIAVEAPEAVRIERVTRRDGMDEAAVKARIARQTGDAQRRAVADWVISTDDSRLILPQLLKILGPYLK